jgi:hypothetical protein
VNAKNNGDASRSIPIAQQTLTNSTHKFRYRPKDNNRGKRYRACLSTDTLESILLGFAAK